MAVGSLLFAVATVVLVIGRASALPPVLFSAGFSGNTLLARVNSTESLPHCPDTIPRGEWFTVWANITLYFDDPLCFYELTRLTYDSATNRYDSPPGVEIKPPDAGGPVSTLLAPEYIYFAADVVVKRWGYTLGHDFWIVPYDFRLSRNGLHARGVYDEYRRLVERVYAMNNNQRVVWIGHSNGPPTVYPLLVESDPEWLDRHIAAFIPLSGNLGGQANAVEPIIFDSFPEFILFNSTLDRQLQMFWESSYVSGPSPAAPFGDRTIVTTHTSTPNPRTYTASTLPQLYIDSGLTESAAMLEAALESMNRTRAPGVDVYCYFGLGLATTFEFAFSGAIDESDPVVTSVDGDSNQDFIDNNFCRVWAPAMEATAHTFVAQSFNGVSHMNMVVDERVLTAIHAALTKY